MLVQHAYGYMLPPATPCHSHRLWPKLPCFHGHQKRVEIHGCEHRAEHRTHMHLELHSPMPPRLQLNLRCPSVVVVPCHAGSLHVLERVRVRQGHGLHHPDMRALWAFRLPTVRMLPITSAFPVQCCGSRMRHLHAAAGACEHACMHGMYLPSPDPSTPGLAHCRSALAVAPAL